MSPEPITRLNAALEGRYQIEGELGQGGMATVYLAIDLKHNRRVALKVLKPELAAVVGAERFLAEIETTANLQHPHILPLFDSGEADSFLFYVMPYVEGETLRDRLNREHQLPVEDSVQIGKNVAEALDYAHARGVIHRDIKPANILLQAGKPVIADFGIALAVGVAGGGRITETGLSLGTPHYMSPEQATGDTHVGPATDVYALGCVLYEMLVGDPPHVASTPQAILGKIITGAPDRVTQHRKAVPANIEATIHKALEKVPADRFRGAGEFARALGDPGFRHGGTERADVATGVGRWNRLTLALSAVAVAASAVAVWSLTRPALTAPSPMRFEMALFGENRAPAPGAGYFQFALSPDGSRIVYVAAASVGGTQLWQRRLGDLRPEPIGDTEGAVMAAFSPDGESIVFSTASGSLRTLRLGEGASRALGVESSDNGETGVEAAWADDGKIYFTREGVVFRVSAQGGEPEAFTDSVPGTVQAHPHPLPDGRGLLVVLDGGAFALTQVAVVGPEGGTPVELVRGNWPFFVEPGYLVYRSDGDLMATAFNPGRPEITGESVTVVEDLALASIGGGDSGGGFVVSSGGTLLYRVADGEPSQVVWVGRDGTEEIVDPGWEGDFAFPALSPDDSRLAVGTRGQNASIFVKQLDQGPAQLITPEGGSNIRPAWNPDGESVTFAATRGGQNELWSRRADGGGQPTREELGEPRGVNEGLWSSDGTWLVYRTDVAYGRGDIFAVRPGVDTIPRELVVTDANEMGPVLSPDDRWLAYRSNESGRFEVYVVPFEAPDSRRFPVSTNGGTEPVWSRDGSELFYRNAAGEMVAAEIAPGPTFSVSGTTVLFPAGRFRIHGAHAQYDVARDGRFLMITEPPPGRIVVVLNFLEELRTRVPD